MNFALSTLPSSQAHVHLSKWDHSQVFYKTAVLGVVITKAAFFFLCNSASSLLMVFKRQKIAGHSTKKGIFNKCGFSGNWQWHFSFFIVITTIMVSTIRIGAMMVFITIRNISSLEGDSFSQQAKLSSV